MNEEEFTEMVKAVREAEKAVGVVSYEPTEKQIKGRVFSRSLYVVNDIKKGDTITEENVRSIRPGFGMHPSLLSNIKGRIAKVNLSKGTRMEDRFI